MADDAAMPAGEEAQLTFSVKAGSDKKLVVTIAANATVADLKAKLATPDLADVPADRQRLIYSGRVLKDPDTLESVKIKDGHTVHLVKGAASNARQNPASQGSGSNASGSGTPTPQVPTNIAAGTGNNPLAGLTGARYAGFHGLPGANTFGPDGGMGGPDPAELLRQMENPNFLQQMNEAMNNPAVVDMMVEMPMIRNNPVMAEMIRNPEMRRLLFNPDMMRMQLQMQQQMNRSGQRMTAPGTTDTTPQPDTTTSGTGTTTTSNPPNPTNPNQQDPLAALLGGAGLPGADQQRGNPLEEMTRQMMQNPEAMQSAMNMLGQMPGGPGASPFGALAGNQEAGAGSTGTGSPPPNPFAALFGPNALGAGGFGSPPPPQDNRPPEEVYEVQLRQLNEMGFYEFDRNVAALRRSGGNVQGAIEHLLSGDS